MENQLGLPNLPMLGANFWQSTPQSIQIQRRSLPSSPIGPGAPAACTFYLGCKTKKTEPHLSHLALWAPPSLAAAHSGRRATSKRFFFRSPPPPPPFPLLYQTGGERRFVRTCIRLLCRWRTLAPLDSSETSFSWYLFPLRWQIYFDYFAYWFLADFPASWRSTDRMIQVYFTVGLGLTKPPFHTVKAAPVSVSVSEHVCKRSFSWINGQLAINLAANIAS